MAGKIKKHQRALLAVLIAVCMVLITIGGAAYFGGLQKNLRESAIQNVMSVTVQQQQAIDTFISGDRERLHSYADYFSRSVSSDPERVRELLGIFDDVDAIFLVMSLDDGWICGTSFSDVRQLEPEELDNYRSLEGSGVRDSYTGLYSKTPRFAFYECFTFADGRPGLIQKSYDRSKVCEAFSLSFYNSQGFAYVVNSAGTILLRATDSVAGDFDENIFDALSGTNAQQAGVNAFMAALDAQESGSLVFDGENGQYVYTYVPIENVEGWYLVSVVSTDAIRVATDKILHSTQTAMWSLLSLAVLGLVFAALIWRTGREIADLLDARKTIRNNSISLCSISSDLCFFP